VLAIRPAELPSERGELLKVHSSAAAAGELPAEEPQGISEGMAAANVAKSILGAGAFALPWAFAKTGVAFTSAYMVISAALCVYCISLMQRARAVALATKPELAARASSYAGLATATLGPMGGRLTEATVLTCCFGICSAFMVFVGATLATILKPPIMETAISQVHPLPRFYSTHIALTHQYSLHRMWPSAQPSLPHSHLQKENEQRALHMKL
jgi:proton-coupled amino acid transporter